MLRGKEPLIEEQRLKVLIYGPMAVGKTLAALQFPNSYIIDTAKETSCYRKLIQKTHSKVFNCSDPYEVMKELEKLRDEKHNFQTLVIDEGTTLYQNLQKLWIDRFIKAQETRSNSAINLLEDFGFRYWDKVKRDWRKLIDLLRQLDMNVIFNAQQKEKYGDNQKIIGVTPDIDKKDGHVFDFVFRLIIRGKDQYKAICEKQRVLPIEIDSEAKRFPKEFDWNYPNLLKFYNKEYIEKPTKNSELKSENKKINQSLSIKEKVNNKNKKDTSFNKTEKSKPKEEKTKKDTPLDKKLTNIDKIKLALEKKNIPAQDFVEFLQNVCEWTDLKSLKNLSEKRQSILMTNWKKIILKFNETYLNQKTKSKEEAEEEIKEEAEVNYQPNEPIREDQKMIIINKLKKQGLTVEELFSGFSIDSWKEISQEGANHMIKNFKVMIGAFE